MVGSSWSMWKLLWSVRPTTVKYHRRLEVSKAGFSKHRVRQHKRQLLVFGICLKGSTRTMVTPPAVTGPTRNAGGMDDDQQEQALRYSVSASYHDNSLPMPVVEGLVSITHTTRAHQTYISRLVLQMESCLHVLQADNVTYPRLEAMAIFIHESMSSSSRNYHSVQHVFDISRNLRDPIAILAALFHDCVYYHVDGGLTEVQEHILQGVLEKRDPSDEGSAATNATQHKVIIRSTGQMKDDDDTTVHSKHSTNYDDRIVEMVEDVFGYHRELEVAARNGLNEFLSAVVAVRELQSHLSIERLALIACCIEATIPFRGVTNRETGETAMERLYNNMIFARDKHSLQLSDEDIVQGVQRAAIMSNEDVGNFGTTDRLWFLDNTWSLLPETNQSLRSQFLYTAKEFQHAVFKMYGFFGFLQPTVVFQQFQNVPALEEIERKTEECRKNLQIGKKYVGAKMLATSVLAAFAELSGGDAPMSLFMGDLPSRHHVSAQLEDALPEPPKEGLSKCDMVVYNILAYGRRTETSFDIKQSPLAAYLYGWLGDDKLLELLGSLKFYPLEHDNSLELLTRLPREAVKNVAKNMAKVALSRSQIIRELIESLP